MARSKRDIYSEIEISLDSKQAFRTFADDLMVQVQAGEIDPRDAVMIMSGYAYAHGYIDAKVEG